MIVLYYGIEIYVLEMGDFDNKRANREQRR